MGELSNVRRSQISRLAIIGAQLGLIGLLGCTPAVPTPTPPRPPATPSALAAAPTPGIPTPTTAPATPTAAVARPAVNPPAPSPSPTGRPPVLPSPTRTVTASIWQRAGLNGTELRAVGVNSADPRGLVAAGPALYRSSDGGANWQSAVNNNKITDLVFLPERGAFAGASAGCLSGLTAPALFSSDGGAWSPIGENLYSITPHPRESAVFYAMTCRGVVRSADGGKTWQPLASSRANNHDAALLGLALSRPEVLYAVYVSEGGGILVRRSEDAGATWRDVAPSNAHGPIDVAVDPFDPQVVFLATSSGLWRTADGGGTWERLTRGLEPARRAEGGLELYNVGALAADPRDRGAYYLGTADFSSRGVGVLATRDGGRSWSRLGDGLGNRAVRDLVVLPQPHILYAATSDGVLRLLLP